MRIDRHDLYHKLAHRNTAGKKGGNKWRQILKADLEEVNVRALL
jgi:hypothetical protein